MPCGNYRRGREDDKRHVSLNEMDNSGAPALGPSTEWRCFHDVLIRLHRLAAPASVVLPIPRIVRRKLPESEACCLGEVVNPCACICSSRMRKPQRGVAPGERWFWKLHPPDLRLSRRHPHQL